MINSKTITTEKILLLLSVAISIVATAYFYFHGQQNLADYDAIARLNIARKVTDSLTPGLGQLGGIWLPIPQVFMIPLTMNDFLWHSGLAGSIVSGIAFIFGAFFLYRTSLLIVKNKMVSIFVWFMFVSNVNILLLQSMAMSESFFLSFFVMVLYFLMRWVKSHNLLDLFATALFLSLITLTRYEGYFILIGATLAIAIDSLRSFLKEGGISKVEGLLVLFLTLAGFGIFLWCLYSFLIFKDPLFWLHVYSAAKDQFLAPGVAQIATPVPQNRLHPTVFAALLAYGGAILWTNGILTVLLGLFGMGLLLINLVKNRANKALTSQYSPLIIVTSVLFGFLVFGYFKGFIPNIEYPPINLTTLLNKSFNSYSHSNIRYGIILAPCILLLIGFAASKSRLLKIVIPAVFAFQMFSGFYTPLFLQFSFPKSWGYQLLSPVPWFKNHYDGSPVLISANRHENFMFQTSLPYRDFIYEGSRNYWTASLADPAKYAHWVIYEGVEGDKVYELLTPAAREILKSRFDLVYVDKTFRIYHLKKV